MENGKNNNPAPENVQEPPRKIEIVDDSLLSSGKENNTSQLIQKKKVIAEKIQHSAEKLKAIEKKQIVSPVWKKINRS